MNRGIWFLAGSAAGGYAVTKVRRAAEVFTYDGAHDRLSGLFVGARLFAQEVRRGAAEKDAELRRRLDLMIDPPEPAPLRLGDQPTTLLVTDGADPGVPEEAAHETADPESRPPQEPIWERSGGARQLSATRGNVH